MEKNTDRELVARYLRNREEDAFVALYRRHTPFLLGFASRLTGGRGCEAEELVQEAWIFTAEGLTAFRWSSSLRTWLAGILINRWRQVARSRERDPATGSSAEVEEAASTPQGLPERIDLGRAVADLPEGYRTVLVLHDIEGFTHEEIGRLLSIDDGTSKSQLSRARTALRQRLAGPQTGRSNERTR